MLWGSVLSRIFLMTAGCFLEVIRILCLGNEFANAHKLQLLKLIFVSQCHFSS